MAEVFNKYGYPCWIKPLKPPTVTGLALSLRFTQPPKAKERLTQKGIDTIDTLTTGGKQQLLYVSFVCEVIRKWRLG